MGVHPWGSRGTDRMKGFKKARIIATLGPASSDVETIRKLIRAGADCFRVNFSHGSGEDQMPLIQNIRKAEELEGEYIPILADIQGPKIRIGTLPKEGILLNAGQKFTITIRDIAGDESCVTTSYKSLPDDVAPGARILLADGSIELHAQEVTETDVVTVVTTGGRLFSNKGINLPHTHLSVETLTEKDRRDLEFISKCEDIDIVAISFVRSAYDIVRAQVLLGERDIPVMAKLERPEAMENLNEILEVADGVMVARGDLGVEMEFEKVPLMQKKILLRASLRGKWAVVATQMLGSMVLNNRPSRAEVSDVANAVIDGADTVMLSEESAIGNHPVRAVEVMARIINEASEAAPAPEHHFDADIVSFAAAAAGAAVSAAERLHAKAIVSLAGSGLTALLLSKWRATVPILSMSGRLATLRRLNVLRGVIPVFLNKKCDMEEQLAISDAYLLENNLANPGDPVIVVAAVPLGQKKETNTIRFHKVRRV